jgi:hypothetical protein
MFKRTVTLAVVATCAACGGLSNEPLRTGTLHGTIPGADPSVAFVSVLGSPDRFATLAADGSFELRVESGLSELFLVGSAMNANRLTVEVRGGERVELGALSLPAAASAQVSVQAEGNPSLAGGTVTVVGTPYADLPLALETRTLVGPLGQGCYAFEVTLPARGQQSASLCLLPGRSETVEVRFSAL